jgi:hypothetical protein
VRPDVTDTNDSAAAPNSDANPSHATAAANIGPEPAPENIRKELISGGNTEKFISYRPFSTGLFSTANPAVTANDTRQANAYHRSNVKRAVANCP